MMDAHEEEALGKAYDTRLMRRLLAYLRPYRPRVAAAVALLLAAAALELVGPILTSIVLDRAIPAGDTDLLLLLATAFSATLLLSFALEYGQTMLTTWLGQRVMYDLRRQIFAHFQRLPLSYFDRNPVGRLMTRVTSDVEVLNELFSSGVVAIFGDLFTLVLIVVAMFVLSAELALVTVIVIPVVVVATIFFRTRIRDAYREIRTRLARINAFLQEHITGVTVIQLFHREAATTDRFRAINRAYLDAHLRSIFYYAIFFPIVEVLTAVAFALIIGYGGIVALNAQLAGLPPAEGAITVGLIAAFLQFARRFFRPMQDLADKYNMLQSAMASAERVFRLLDTEVAPHGGDVLPPRSRGSIEFRDVWFAYQRQEDGTGVPAQGDWVLRGVSFHARAGEKVAIVGHTGAGKTSLISLLMRYYEPQRGEILLDGVPIRRLDVETLRQRIGLVLQDVFLFSRDVAYNIRLGRTDISADAVARAAHQAGAATFIDRLPHGYAEPLGERGASLSVGQRQLLSFARALAFDPRILILDEATSSVDSQLEARIEAAVNTLMQGRTALVIAHRLSTVQGADRILVLHHGELREEGTHDELLARGGLYARLHALQFTSS